ncbi:MAG TPA: flagellar hook-length control protein FliK [Candidatus Scatocola faecipullorum]|uniref:Flagellar hook-length control protein FliK n=2 Tax=Candidatus Scatocola faecipullorum TaxID=2840917 RepID=A0A9D1M5H6_9PROT|nr:flagellar hook-length control protein FliK [Candidatus Scatocola faecipullorum]
MMDIKDVNNGLLNLLQANRANLQGTAVNTTGFGDLLAGLESEKTPSVEVKADFREAKNAASSNLSKPRAEDKSVAGREQKTENKSASDRREDKVKEQTEAEKAEKPQNEKTDNSSAEKPEKAENGGNERPSAEKPTEKEAAGDVSGAERADEIAAAEDAPAVSDEAAPESGMAEGMEISLDALALMGAVTVVNPATGETFQTTGAELAAQLADAGVQSVSVLPGEEGQPLVAPVVEHAPEAAAFQNIVAAMKKTQAENAPVVDADAVAADAASDQDILAQQAAKLGETVGEDRKVKVEVSVKEEKIADAVDGGLVKNAKLSDETLSAVVESKDAVKGNPLTEVKTPAQQAAPQNQIREMPLTMTAGAVSNAAAAAADDTAAVAVSTETGSVTLAHAGTVGGEMLANAKASAANDSSSTSFRDVYKGMGKEVVDQIKVNITKSAVKGVDKIEIQLKPEDLGHIEVKMQIGKDGKLQAHIVASRPETAEILQKEIGNLQKAFNEAGFQTDEGSLSFSFRDDGQAGQNQERNNLRNFIGDVLEQETAMDAAVGDLFAGTAWDGKNGLNIRV